MFGRAWQESKLPTYIYIPYYPCMVFTYIRWIFMVHVGKYTSPMDPMGSYGYILACYVSWPEQMMYIPLKSNEPPFL